MTTAPSQKAPAKKPASSSAVESKASKAPKAPVATAASVAAKPAVAAPVAAAPVSTAKAAVAPAAKAVVKPAVKPAAKPAVKEKPAARKAPAAKAATVGKTTPAAAVREKVKKEKLVRDSFTMPEVEYAALGEVKKACLKAGFEVKKSELLRLGVVLVRRMEPAALKSAIAALAPLKPGRPKKDK